MYRVDRLNSVKFHGTKYGQVDKFKRCLEKALGKEWSKRILDPNDDLADVPTVTRLGIPGRQGTTIKLHCDRKDYAIKVTRKKHKMRRWGNRGDGIFKTSKITRISRRARSDTPCRCCILWK